MKIYIVWQTRDCSSEQEEIVKICSTMELAEECLKTTSPKGKAWIEIAEVDAEREL